MSNARDLVAAFADTLERRDWAALRICSTPMSSTRSPRPGSEFAGATDMSRSMPNTQGTGT
jgi:hypothetical protein